MAASSDTNLALAMTSDIARDCAIWGDSSTQAGNSIRTTECEDVMPSAGLVVELGEGEQAVDTATNARSMVSTYFMVSMVGFAPTPST